MKLFSNKGLCCRVLLLTITSCVLISLKSNASAQELAKALTEQPTNAKEVTVSDRVRLLETELERQNTKLDELQKTIADQQLAIKALLERLSEGPPASADAPVNPVPAKAPAETETATAQTQSQSPSVEQRLAKVEGQAIHIGPLRLSGDFRLRFDGTFRSASDPGDPPLQHLQNARARYRLRLNFDTDLYPTLSFHGQLATGPLNNPQTLDQDFGSVTARHPMAISEAWIDYHPTKAVQLQAGRVQAIFADNSRFLFDDDIRFNGFNERYIWALKKNGAYVSNIDFRAGQYILTNPNVAIVAPNSPLARAGEIVGSTGRASNLFHQGLLINQTFNERWSDQIGADVQLYRNPNQIQLASTADGVALVVQPGLGITLSGPLTGNGTATTTPGGAIYTAPGFQVARLAYRLNYAGFKHNDHNFPVTLNLQFARNMGTGLNERDAMLAALQVGRITKRGDTAFLYVFSIKGANSLISQVTDDDLGTGSGVNIRTSHFRFEYGIARKVTLQSLFFFQQSLRSSGQYPNFFVPLGSFAPTTYRIQQQLVFSF
jgi:hypothetical protein